MRLSRSYTRRGGCWGPVRFFSLSLSLTFVPSHVSPNESALARSTFKPGSMAILRRFLRRQVPHGHVRARVRVHTHCNVEFYSAFRTLFAPRRCEARGSGDGRCDTTRDISTGNVMRSPCDGRLREFIALLAPLVYIRSRINGYNDVDARDVAAACNA